MLLSEKFGKGLLQAECREKKLTRLELIMTTFEDESHRLTRAIIHIGSFSESGTSNASSRCSKLRFAN